MSILQLLNINDLNNTYEHTIDFPDLETQNMYFSDKVNTSIDLPEDDYVYIRENKTIEVDKNKQDLLGINYLRFNNGNKWWYAFITSKTYINESVTSIEFEVDPIQTFMFDYEIRESYVTREHQDRFNTDKQPLFNLREESLELGSEYIKTSEELINDCELPDTRVMACLVIASKSIESSGIGQNTFQGATPDLPDPLQYYIIPIINKPTTTFYINSTERRGMTASDLCNELKGRDDYGEDDLTNQTTKYGHILNMCILPYFPFDYTLTKEGNNYIFRSDLTSYYLYYANPLTPLTKEQRYIYHLNNNTLKTFLADLNVKSKLNIPTPSFNITTARDIKYETKLYTHPYSYLTLDCDQTEPLTIQPQYLDNLETNILFNQAIGINPINRFYVEGYKGDTGNDTTLINNTQNDLTVASDKLIDYLAQNKASATTGLAVNTGIDVGVTAIRTIVGVVGKNPFAISNAISDVASIAKNIANENYKRHDLSQGSLNFKAKGNNIYAYIQQYKDNAGIKVRTYSIAEQFKIFAYNYFYHFGYLTNDFKLPDIKSRYYFNYIQIPDINIKTKIDNEYIQKLKSIYNNGITFWHYRNADTFRGIDDYTYENVEMNLIGV